MRRVRRTSVRTTLVGTVIAAMALMAAPIGHAEPTPAGNRAPDAPAALTVNDRERPLNVEGAPTFGWLPQDRDPGEVQTAYQLRVTDAAGALVWDSGKVASDAQQYVPYGGTELERGATYHWTVRTWDGSDAASPWADAAVFDTGIADEDWDATWIRRPPGADGPISIVDDRARVQGGDVTLANAGHGWTDYTLELTVRPHTRGAGFVFRSPDPRNGYMWQLYPGRGLSPHVLRDGRFTRLGTIDLDVEAGTDYAVRVELEGPTIRTYIDGELVDEREDDTFDAGTVGFREASNEIGEFDDVVVTGADGQVLLADDFSGDLRAWDNRSDERQPDEWTLARTEVALHDADVTRARAYTASSHTYELYLDGERADRGQSFAYPGEHYYQASDVTDLVRGRDAVAIGAMLHWYGSGQGRPGVEPGLLMRLEIEYADGTKQAIVTDGSWKVTEGPYRLAGRRNGEGEWIEHLDATRIIEGWQELGFDDAGWQDAEVVGEHPTPPFSSLRGQETRLAETRVSPERLLTADDGTIVADFGVVIPARPSVRFAEGEEGRTIQMRAGYDLSESGRVDTSRQSTQTTNMVYPYTQVDGEQHFQAFTHLAFRYLEIPGAGEDLALEDISAVVVHTDTPEGRRAEFTSSDDTLNAVWELMERSAIYSVQEAFVDTPTREKGQFLGDAVAISYATMALFGERDATQQAIREFVASADRFWSSESERGRYNAVYPNGDGKRDIPDYSLRFVDWVWRYYLETGDVALLEEVYPAIRDTAGYVLRHIPDDGPTAGLVTNLSGGSGPYRYGIVDWPTPGRFGYDMDTAARTTINAESAHVLRLVADIGDRLGRPADEVERYGAAASELVATMNDRLRRDDGVFIDGLRSDGTQSTHAGQHSTSYAIGYGIAPEDDWPQLAEHIATMGMKQGPMTVHWLLRALGDADRPGAVLELLTDEDDLGWADILAQDGTFTWETWTPEPGSDHSESHGWGAQAAVDVLETLLGLEVTTPGAATVEITPPDVDGLDHAAGTVHTQRGPVSVEWRQHPHGLQLEIDVPVNVTARVALPVSDDTRSYRAAGPSRAEFVGIEDGRAVFEVGSGASRFSPVAGGAAQPGRGAER